MLAGIVENPTAYNPLGTAQQRPNTSNGGTRCSPGWRNSTTSRQRRRGRGEDSRSDLNPSVPQSGCTSGRRSTPRTCVTTSIAVIRHDTAYKQTWARLNGLGGLTITTTLDPKDQQAADKAVNYMLPPPPSGVNPGRNADTEVLIQPGTGTSARSPSTGLRHRQAPNVIDYAVGPQYDGSEGVADRVDRQGVDHGDRAGAGDPVRLLQARQRHGHRVRATPTARARSSPPGISTNDQSELTPATYSLYTGTTDSINVFFAYLEQKVGLCNVIKTATQMGLTWPDGKSLLKPDRREHHLASADNDPSFTLGADNLAPMDVAASDATLPARGIYCSPIAITKIVTTTGQQLPVESAHCHRALPQAHRATRPTTSSRVT